MIKIIFEEKKKKPSLDPSLDSEKTTMTEEKLPINDIKYGCKYIHVSTPFCTLDTCEQFTLTLPDK